MIRLIEALLGAWIGCTLFMVMVAAGNFRTVDRVLTAPTREAAAPISSVAEPSRRPLLRHLASEMNRLYFRLWGGAQVVIGLVVLLLVWRFSGRSAAALAAAALALVLIEVLALTPRIVSIGREMDFLPRVTAPPQMRTFGMLHAAYSTLDLIKLIVLGVLAWKA